MDEGDGKMIIIATIDAYSYYSLFIQIIAAYSQLQC